jgi:site-specific recombinase XerD
MELVPLDEIYRQLKNRYDSSGFSPYVIRTDWQIIRRIGVHPAIATREDLEKVVLAATKQSTKANYVSRLRSIYKHLNKLNLVNGNNPAVDLPDVKPGRGVPKPVTKAEYAKLLAEANQPYRDWFILGGMAGLRCMEAAKIKGSDLIETEEGPMLQVLGKGNTDLVVPISPVVAEMIKSHNTLDRLWKIDPNKFSKKAADEMRRILGPDAKHFHSLRHYFATTMLEKSGGDLIAVKELMRHTSVATTQVYTQLAHGRTRTLVNLLE